MKTGVLVGCAMVTTGTCGRPNGCLDSQPDGADRLGWANGRALALWTHNTAKFGLRFATFDGHQRLLGNSGGKRRETFGQALRRGMETRAER